MKQYTKNWLTAFTISTLVCTVMVLAFLLWALPEKTDEEISRKQSEIENEPYDASRYTNPADNVGAVSFTEDMITELARNMYSSDGYLTRLHVDFEKTGDILIEGRISSADNLIEAYPELTALKPLALAVENKSIKINCKIEDDNGTAKISVKSADVAGVKLSEQIIKPIVEMSDFSQIFDVNFESIEITDDMLIFYDGVPTILQY